MSSEVADAGAESATASAYGTKGGHKKSLHGELMDLQRSYDNFAQTLDRNYQEQKL
jgi:hypothetical protein